MGSVPTVTKAYRDPDSETLTTWVASLIASACALLSVGKIDLIILAYPLYLFTLYLAFVTAILAGRRAQVTHKPAVETLVLSLRHAPTTNRFTLTAICLYVSDQAIAICRFPRSVRSLTVARPMKSTS